jgi:hypothetical protein
MSKFEFIMMFVSVVVAFSLAELMMGWGRLIRGWQQVQRPLFVLGWSFWLLVVITFHYLGFWEYQYGVDLRSVGQMLLGLSAPIVLVLLSFVLTPELREGQPTDLEEHYFRIKDWFFPLVLVFFLLSALADTMLPDFRETWVTRIMGPAMLAVSFIPLFFTRRRSVHVAVLAFNLVLIVVSSYTLDVRAL